MKHTVNILDVFRAETFLAELVIEFLDNRGFQLGKAIVAEYRDNMVIDDAPVIAFRAEFDIGKVVLMPDFQPFRKEKIPGRRKI